MSSVTLAAVDDNAHQLDVSWTLSADIGRCPGYYKVTWDGIQTGEDVVQDTTRYTITGLETWTTYDVCVDSGETSDSLFDRPKCATGKTAEDGKCC